jgi:hypothetical protein
MLNPLLAFCLRRSPAPTSWEARETVACWPFHRSEEAFYFRDYLANARRTLRTSAPFVQYFHDAGLWTDAIAMRLAVGAGVSLGPLRWLRSVSTPKIYAFSPLRRSFSWARLRENPPARQLLSVCFPGSSPKTFTSFIEGYSGPSQKALVSFGSGLQSLLSAAEKRDTKGEIRNS